MTKGKKNSVLQWISKAEMDLVAAKRLMKEDPLTVSEIIGFLCQQSIEKYLKAYLAFKNYDFRKTHDLEELRDICAKFDKDFEHFDYFNLTEYAVEFRYSSDEFAPGQEEIEYFISLAEKTKNLIIEKVK